MPRLRRILRLFAVTVLVLVGTCAVVSNASGAEVPRDDKTYIRGFDQKTLVEVCDHYQGKYLEDLPRPYSYGCAVSDGQINCEETANCAFMRISGRPFEQTCERAGDKYTFDKLDFFRCWQDKPPPVVLHCDPKWETCAIGHEQPIP